MKKVTLLFLPLLLIAYCLLLPTSASAHDATLTYTSISLTDTTINVAITTPYKNIQAIYPEKNKPIDDMKLDFFAQPFTKGFVITNNGEKCQPKLTNTQTIPDIQEVAYEFEFTCKKAFDKLHFSYDLFFTVSNGHENITDFYADDFEDQIIFSKKLPSYDLPVKELQAKVNIFHTLWNACNFLILGISHIFTGYDHVLFLLGLMLVAKNFRSLLKIITAFTIAHSITLILSSLDIVSLSTRFTESMIALSISYIAFENIKILRGKNLVIGNWKFEIGNWKFLHQRWLIAFLFGLIHGFGFSSVLQEIGLPAQGLILSLLSFNVGVEIGQIVILCLILPALWYIRKQTWEKRALLTTSVIIGILGLFWFLQRIL